MEQGHTDAEFVVSRKAHILTSEVAIVGNTIVRQHDPLGESRGTAGILHVTDIVAGHVLLHLVQRIVLYILSQQEQFGGIIHTSIFLHANIYHTLQEGETLTVQVSTLTGFQLR